ncbi:MAG: NAD(P)-binding domain-containing protein, partial [Pseudomonadales bacterium]
MSDRCIGVIGLGNMGRGMCQSLLREGFEVYGADLGAQQCELAREMGVKVVASLQELCEATKTILLSLPAAKHVQQVVLGESGLINTARPDTLIIDTSTSEPDVTRALAQQLSDSGLAMLDAPVSGGPAGAAAGTMVMVVGGSELSLARAMPFFEALSSKVVHLGDSGSGHAAKLINNLLCAAHLVTTAEALALGESAGLDAAKLLEGLNAGSGRSAVSEVNFPRWILSDTFDSGFTMQLMRMSRKKKSRSVYQKIVEIIWATRYE